MKYIELFAGCGGLSLGLQSAGFKLLFANELSPIAGETYAFNQLNENLAELARSDNRPSKTLWVNSQYPPEQLSARLRENPQLAPEFGAGFSEFPETLKGLNGKLLIGSIIDLNKHLSECDALVNELREENVDLVSGGPPCQSFSLAGMREQNNSRNTLPMDFADFIGYVQPKIAMLENVSGILRAFQLSDGPHYAWFEIARAFSSKGYVPLCLHVNAKFSGAAQNRPRFILFAFRKDIFDKISKNVTSSVLSEVLDSSIRFYSKEAKGRLTKANVDLIYHDQLRGDQLFMESQFLPLSKFPMVRDFFTVKDAIDDLRRGSNASRDYSDYINESLQRPSHVSQREIRDPKNHDYRTNSIHVRKRFRLYQHLRDSENGISKNVISFLQNPEERDLSEAAIEYLLDRQFLSDDGSEKTYKSRSYLVRYIKGLKTKKHTQRALVENVPAPAALSIPDDACHYHSNEPRTLTVREMARFQSFPDWFEFRSKVTTGGKMRRFEVPQYTQVGNAVPPLLGKSLGEVIENLLNTSRES